MKSFILLTLIIIFLIPVSIISQNIPFGDDDLVWKKNLQNQKVNAAVFHPTTGNIIAALNNQILELDPKNGNTLRTFIGGLPGQETDEYLGLVVTTDGKYVVTGSGNDLKGVNVWDYAQGKHLYTVKIFGYVDNSDNVDLLPSGNKVLFLENTQLVSSATNKFTVFSLDIEKQIATDIFSILHSNCEKFKVSRSGNYIVTALKQYTSENKWNHSVMRIDLSDLKIFNSFGIIQGAERIEDLQVSNDGKFIGLKADNFFFLYEDFTKKVILNDLQMLYSFTFSDDSKYLVMSYLNKSFQYSTDIIDLATLTPFYRYSIKPTLVRLNKHNELFTDEMSYYSNHWFALDVGEDVAEKVHVYTQDNEIKILHDESIEISHFIITDNLGREFRFETDGDIIRTGLPNCIKERAINSEESYFN